MKAVAITPLEDCNVRSQPNINGRIIGVLKRFSDVELGGTAVNGWQEILQPFHGWVYPGVKFHKPNIAPSYYNGPVNSYRVWPVSLTDQPMPVILSNGAKRGWPDGWIDASPFNHVYFAGTTKQARHTGADLNLPKDADAGKPIFAIGSGSVSFAGLIPVWGKVLILKLDPDIFSRQIVYVRYAHMNAMLVRRGERVDIGGKLGTIGNAEGKYPNHLHFDISPSSILEYQPGHWPKMDEQQLLLNYVNPLTYLLDHAI